ncbi:hypothetical protein CBP20_13640 [Fischerella thermalis WC213]|nr:hypothetical protein CBP20_13640 [Fischerella thermalis WC213]
MVIHSSDVSTSSISPWLSRKVAGTAEPLPVIAIPNVCTPGSPKLLAILSFVLLLVGCGWLFVVYSNQLASTNKEQT